jgi:Carboxypeptidase regulatory-like domain/TonB-dependent Receptor Plug Domain
MNWKRFFAAVFALLVVLTLSATRVAAQTSTTGDLTGTVTDPSGSVVPSAKVTLKDESKGATQETTTSREGTYRFYLLTPSRYDVTVSVTGFESVTRTADVGVGQIASVNFTLTVGTASTTVTVTEAAPLLQTDNGDTATSVTQQQVSNVPNPGNDLTAIAQLAPGVISNNQGGFGNVEAFGMPATSNLFTMNGMDDNDPFLNLGNSGATNLLLGTNEVQEADVVTNGFSAAYGTFAGIDVNYVTKSGGNDFHGNLVYFWNGRALNAEGWLDKNAGVPKPFDNANQWAASIGGPIKKDKLFFFVNTEGLRVLIPVPSSFDVPTLPFETAIVNNLNATGLAASVPFYCQNITGVCPGVTGVPGSGAGAFNSYNGALNQQSASQITNGGCSNANFTGGPFEAFGVGNPCAVNLRENPINFAPEWQIAGRLDWNVGANDRAFMRVQYDVGTQPTFTDPLNPIFNASSYQPEYQGQLNETHTFSPSLTNQFLLAATWYSAIFKNTQQAASLATFPTSLILGDVSLGDQTSGLNLGGEGFAFPQGRNVTQFQIGDDVSKLIGNHTLKFGVKFHKNWVSDHDFGNRIEGLEIPFSLADFANGGLVTPTNGSVGTELQQNFSSVTNVPVRLYEFAGYFQDDWKVKSNLTISPGLRIEHASNPTCVINCFAQLNGTLADVGADPTAPYNTQILSGRHQALNNYTGVQWSPRLSFAWQPFSGSTDMWKSNFVVRGGVGIFYDIFPGAIADNLAQNAPQFNTFTEFSGSAACPGFLSPNQPGNIFGCASSDNATFLNAFNTGASTVPLPPGFTYTDPHTSAPQFQKWNLQIQKGFGPNDVISIGYNGNHGIHIPVFDNGVNAFCDPTAVGSVCPQAGGFTGLPEAPVTSQFGTVTDVTSGGVSNYNGLTASYQHRFSGLGGGLVQFNYTYSKALDDVSNGGFFTFAAAGNILNPQNPFDLKGNYGPADYDARQVINANYVWQVPIRKALMGHGWAPLVDGWQVSGTVFYRTGFPFTVVDTAMSNALASSNFGGPIFPDVISGSTLGTSCNSSKFAGGTAVPCLAFSQFVGAGTETGLGPALRGAFRGPNYFDTDFNVQKKFAIPHWERGAFMLGFQFFNLFNHPNFANPVNDINSGAFGTIQSQVNPPTSILGSFLGGDASPRLIQVKGQITF